MKYTFDDQLISIFSAGWLLIVLILHPFFLVLGENSEMDATENPFSQLASQSIEVAQRGVSKVETVIQELFLIALSRGSSSS